MPAILLGCDTNDAMVPMDNDDVFDAMMHPAGTTASNAVSTSLFTARSSKTASMTRSDPAKSSIDSVVTIRDMISD